MTPKNLISQFKAGATPTDRAVAMAEMTRYDDITPFIETIKDAALEKNGEDSKVRKCAVLAIRTRPEIIEHDPDTLSLLGRIAIHDSDPIVKTYAHEALSILLPTAQATPGKYDKTWQKMIEYNAQETPFSPGNGGKLINPVKENQRVFHKHANEHPLAFSFWRVEHSGDGEVAASASPEVKKGTPPSWFTPPEPE